MGADGTHLTWPHTGALLAGGASERMGQPKENLVLPDGRTMIEAVAAALAPVCARLVVVGATDALPDLVHVEDLRPGQGPLGGIEALLASEIDTEYIVCPCDVPRVTPEVIASLAIPSLALATVLRIEGEADPRPLPARFSTAALGPVRAQLDAGRRAVHRLLKSIAVDSVAAPSGWSDLLANINTPADLRKWEGSGTQASNSDRGIASTEDPQEFEV